MKVLVCSMMIAVASAAVAADAQPIPQDRVAMAAVKVVELAEKIAEAPIKFSAEPAKATGLAIDGDKGAAIVIPREGLKETEESLKEAGETNGAPFGYLCLYRMNVASGGKALAAGKAPSLTIKSEDDKDVELIVFRLSAKKISDTEWKLLVFGSDKQPVATSSFREEQKAAAFPLVSDIKDFGISKGTLVVYLYGKYAANIDVILAD